MNLPKPEPELICDLIDSLNKRWGVPFDIEGALKQSEEHHYSERRRLAEMIRIADTLAGRTLRERDRYRAALVDLKGFLSPVQLLSENETNLRNIIDTALAG